MRRIKTKPLSSYKIIVLDDETGIIDSLSVVLKRNGYDVYGVTSPDLAVEMIRKGKYDLLILDFLMQPYNGDKAVAKIREFNAELYILLLTGHTDIAPPLETIRSLDIQGYCEKSDKFDQLILLVESAVKSIRQTRLINNYQEGLNKILAVIPRIYRLQEISAILDEVLIEIMHFIDSRNAFILVDMHTDSNGIEGRDFLGIGQYDMSIDEFMAVNDLEQMAKIVEARTDKKVIKTNGGLFLPLVNVNGETLGVIYAESSNYRNEAKLLEIYANQAAAALENAFLLTLVNTKNDELTSAYAELKRINDGTLASKNEVHTDK